ncbi:MAG: hypothetical protein WED09_07230 [Homoserinimonas sp.]
MKINNKGAVALLKSQAVLDELEARALRMEEAIPPGNGTFTATGWIGKDRTGGRAMAMVKTMDTEARRAQAVDNVLTRAIDAGRG